MQHNIKTLVDPIENLWAKYDDVILPLPCGSTEGLPEVAHYNRVFGNRTWRTLTLSELIANRASLSFFDSRALQVFIASFMIAGVTSVDVLESVLSALTLHDRYPSLFSRLHVLLPEERTLVLSYAECAALQYAQIAEELANEAQIAAESLRRMGR